MPGKREGKELIREKILQQAWDADGKVENNSWKKNMIQESNCMCK